MSDIGFLELVVIAVVALLVVGPERLPGVIKKVSSWLAKARHFTNSIRDELEREANLAEIREQLKQQGEQLKSQLEVFEKEKNQLLDKLEESAEKGAEKSTEKQGSKVDER